MEELPTFRFTNAELCQRGDKLAVVFKRDEAAFLNYGYPVETTEQIIALTEALKAFSSDDYYEGVQQMATTKKNTYREELVYELTDLKNRFRLTYGNGSPELKVLKLNNINKFNDNELVQKALHAYQVCETRLPALAKRNVTQESLDILMSSRSKLDDAIDEQATAVTLRREKTLERNKMGNELYKLLSELCEVGKLIWKGKNEAYYTDYVIYGSSKGIVEQTESIEAIEEN
ncbi:hypothetical protein [Carboxylicivirga sp. M1479]|uniref:hypothetical protein n=1 Tax=Carboxylicivirga sp. M1479 TaxID=2594476 RepID=UPI00117777E2|nr:hypothetical protein [Carboxylicivirga sp. M1479]TRX71641.1 hypothetical protein FNN09_05230 [Carboxylicivirga sp. M1479]